MARGDKKITASPPVSRPTEPAVMLKAPTPALVLPPEEGARAHSWRASLPRMTTDDPWRDLHPMRIWPD